MARMTGGGLLMPHRRLRLMIPCQGTSGRLPGGGHQEVHRRTRRDGGRSSGRLDNVAAMTAEHPPGTGHEQQQRRYEAGPGEEGEALPSPPAGCNPGHQQLLGLRGRAAVLGRARRQSRTVAAIIAIAWDVQVAWREEALVRLVAAVGHSSPHAGLTRTLPRIAPLRCLT